MTSCGAAIGGDEHRVDMGSCGRVPPAIHERRGRDDEQTLNRSTDREGDVGLTETRGVREQRTTGKSQKLANSGNGPTLMWIQGELAKDGWRHLGGEYLRGDPRACGVE